MDSDNRKYTLLSFFLVSALTAYILYLFSTQIVDWLKWGGSNVLFGYSWPVVGGVVCGLIGVILLIVLSTNTTSTTFIDEVFSELQKTTWPNMKENSISTVVVSVMVGLAALVLFCIDYIWGVFFKAIL